jgi:transposase-like protein
LLMKLMFEILLGRAATEQIGALPFERTGTRRIYRNGNDGRSLGARCGTIENLLIIRGIGLEREGA